MRLFGRMVAGAVCLSGLSGAASAEVAWGANGHPFAAYPIPIEAQLDLLKDLRMTSYRVDISDVARAGDLAVLVREAKARGIDILPVLTPGNLDLDQDDPDTLYRKARSFAYALASQFKDDLRVWELGNELENYAIVQPCEILDDGTQYPCEWGPAGGTNALDYFGPRWAKVSAVLKGLSDGVVEVDPTLRKAIGTAGWGHTGAFERMQQDGIAWDISVWHVYGQDPEWAFEILAGYDRPIWVTEFNNPYGSQSSAEQQASGLKAMMRRLAELQDEYDIEAAHVYELLDEPYWAPDFEAYMGLVEVVATDEGGWALGARKPAYVAVREMIQGDGRRRACDLAETAAMEPLAVRQVSYASCLVLGRDADDALLAAWLEPLETGASSFADMLVAMLGSPEFMGKYSTLNLTDSEYVALLYRVLVNREADNYGLQSWAQQITEGTLTRATVASSIAASSEFMTQHAAAFGS